MIDKRLLKTRKTHDEVEKIAIRRLTYHTGLFFDEAGLLLPEYQFSNKSQGQQLVKYKTQLMKPLTSIRRELDIYANNFARARSKHIQTVLKDSQRILKAMYRLITLNVLFINQLLSRS